MNSHLQLIQNKIVTLTEAVSLSLEWKKNGDVVFTNGCFDILHSGHLHYLSSAADLGNKLIIGLNSDNSIANLKGKNRPFIKESDRLLMLASLAFVDAVVLFEQDTPIQLIESISPDILVKGGDYTEENIVGHQIVKKNGGKVISLQFLEGYSTTNFIEKIKHGKN
ncbi:MAG: D-glycero-beta-D-manno-heptose 1-phosphate adenylyltransferase [Flavobacteriales bacterium]|tara:strand:- start:6297 stop:6794 length:498 start_codon:yes stop_codon:yes gene_type:complete